MGDLFFKKKKRTNLITVVMDIKSKSLIMKSEKPDGVFLIWTETQTHFSMTESNSIETRLNYKTGDENLQYMLNQPIESVDLQNDDENYKDDNQVKINNFTDSDQDSLGDMFMGTIGDMVDLIIGGIAIVCFICCFGIKFWSKYYPESFYRYVGRRWSSFCGFCGFCPPPPEGERTNSTSSTTNSASSTTNSTSSTTDPPPSYETISSPPTYCSLFRSS